MMIRRQRVVAKLIEISTELLQSTSAASGGIARYEGKCCSVPPPPRALRPESRATFRASVMSQHEEGLHEWVARLETEFFAGFIGKNL